jgi:transcriptional regulator with PAS, ATPase and Fis domain
VVDELHWVEKLRGRAEEYFFLFSPIFSPFSSILQKPGLQVNQGCIENLCNVNGLLLSFDLMSPWHIDCSFCQIVMKRIYQIFFSHNSKLSKIQAIVEDIARTDISILIKGESGTGKSLVAQAIHQNSLRNSKPFIKVNCAAIPKGLLESELFGFEKGAFTGAHMKKPGKFELANEGTILLNEIGEMDISVQGKLLQVLQDGQFCRLGGNGTVSVNTRIIATTQNHLEQSVKEGFFREDLFYRINTVTVTIPPLRDRKEQIVPFSQYFLNLYRTKYGRSVSSLSLRTLGAFKSYPWPGNLRELENTIKRIVLLGDEEAVVEGLVREKTGNGGAREIQETLSGMNSVDSADLRQVGRKAAESAEKRVIENTLHETRWNRKNAARLLGVSYKTLLNKIQKYHLDKVQEL